MKYDLAIIGGGFAGLSCAFEAATRGLRVGVLERKSRVSVRPHTTGLFVKEAAQEWNLPSHLTKVIRGIRLYSPSLKSIDLKSPNYYFLATDTSGVLDWFYYRALSAGADIVCGEEFRASALENNLIRVTQTGITARYVAGCDGALSRVARDYSLSQNKRFLVGMEKEFEGVGDVEDNFLHCFIDPDHAPGYIGWVIPGLGMTQVGVACSSGNTPKLDGFIKKISSIFNFSKAKLINMRGGLIPAGGTLKNIGNEKVCLLGDAAGYVSPLTGGGIKTSLRMGKRAGELIPQYLNNAGPRPDLVLKKEISQFRVKKIMSQMMSWRSMSKLSDVCFHSSAFRKFAEYIFFHYTTIGKGTKGLAPVRDNYLE